MRTFVMTGMVVGSLAGGYIPVLWGAGVLSMTSLFCGAAGGFLGIWIAYRIARNWA